MVRKILHVDMDAFYASVEQRDNPDYRGKPIIVGGPPDSRGVVCAASYEARKFGVKSAMPCSQAARLCPSGIFVTPRFEAYRRVSSKIKEIFLEFTDLVEMLSLDEAFLDVTENKKNIPYASQVAKEIRERIFEETQLTASAGVSINKFLAKIATDQNKPNGMTIVRPEQAEKFIESLDVSVFPGIGKVTLRKMHALGIKNGKDLKEKSLETLDRNFGKSGRWFYAVCRGLDDRPVQPYRERKSLGAESTFPKDLENSPEIFRELADIAEELERRLLQKPFPGKTITLKVKFSDFTQKTRSITEDYSYLDKNELYRIGSKLLEEFILGSGKAVFPIRLLGLSLSHPENNSNHSRIKSEEEEDLFPSLF
ncbi:DNA polymerase IV [Leptospira sp. WS58.C1]|uniref:DNA polymerase IV n=1 Tax=Leptospira TaxID=171 RepID=UPI0002BD4F89|nr:MULTISPECIES: DNA polymerase IV [unclassified Leptospira]EMJ98947.1 ImpB/MucB/SamB family protein [Leptospira sp. B5-022]MCR1794765.1 DNA polymerase IV [Leptospira sp. id769339]